MHFTRSIQPLAVLASTHSTHTTRHSTQPTSLPLCFAPQSHSPRHLLLIRPAAYDSARFRLSPCPNFASPRHLPVAPLNPWLC